MTAGTDTLVLTPEKPPEGVTIAKQTGVNNYFGYDGSGFLASIGGSVQRNLEDHRLGHRPHPLPDHRTLWARPGA
jgi:hypothetical protein